MKTESLHRITLKNVLVRITCFALFIGNSNAASLQWDASGTLPIDGGSGNWSGGSTWYNGTTFQTWSNWNDAIFGGTGDTVVVNNSFAVGDFQVNSTGYSFRINGGTTILTVSSFSGTELASSSFFVPANATATLRLSVSGTTNATYSGSIVGAVNRTLTLSKIETGTLTLTSNGNTYIGGTTVSVGTLLVNNTSGSGVGTGSVTVSGGAALGGTGIITLASGNSVTNSGTISVGDGASAETFDINTSGAGSLAFNNNSALTLDIWTNSLSGADKLATTGAVSIGSNVTLTLSNSGSVTFSAGNEFDLFDWGTSPTGTFALTLPTLSGPLSWDTSNLYTTGVISVVPEPKSATLFTIAGLLALIITRKRRSV